MKKFWNSKWTFALITSFAGTLFTVFIDWLKKKDIFSTLKLVFTTVWRWLLAFLNFEIKVWWILVALGVLVVILWVIAKIANAKESDPPAWMQYTEDRFTDWKWSWTWEKGPYGKYQVANLVAHCPKCDTPMRHDNYDTVFHCSRCQYDSRRHKDNHDDVLIVIHDNIQRKTQKQN